MNTFWNVIKLIIIIVIIGLIGLGLFMIFKNFSAIGEALNGSSQTVIDTVVKVKQVEVSIESITF